MVINANAHAARKPGDYPQVDGGFPKPPNSGIGTPALQRTAVQVCRCHFQDVYNHQAKTL